MYCWIERIQEIKLSHSTRFSFVRADLSVTGALQPEIVVVDTYQDHFLDIFFHVFQWVYHCRLQNVWFSSLDFLEITNAKLYDREFWCHVNPPLSAYFNRKPNNKQAVTTFDWLL